MWSCFGLRPLQAFSIVQSMQYHQRRHTSYLRGIVYQLPVAIAVAFKAYL